MAYYGDPYGAIEFHAARGNDAWSAEGVTAEQQEAALQRGTDWVDAEFGEFFPGVRTGGRAQELAWPRINADGTYVTDLEGNEIEDYMIPVEIERATYEAALIELTDPGTLAADLERGGAIKRMKAGSVEIEYADGAPVESLRRRVVNALKRLIVTKKSSTVVGFSARA